MNIKEKVDYGDMTFIKRNLKCHLTFYVGELTFVMFKNQESRNNSTN
jgi:hypothetical protein